MNWIIVLSAKKEDVSRSFFEENSLRSVNILDHRSLRYKRRMLVGHWFDEKSLRSVDTLDHSSLR